ncbi:MAG: hypothetical protein L0H41_05725 [Microlunatus sp.]|nr:hypothetical protein [Microlunatus sp.]MDN5770890.1 hypothetical protein [Microlunatus sp.]MDN5803823.1 hypothetical protein [Microlunatus sp.]
MTSSSETNEPEHESPLDPQQASPRDNVARVRWWVAAITFVGGAVVGIVVVGLLFATTPDFATPGSNPGGSPAPDGQQTPVDGSVPVTAEARVNAACLRVINEAQDVQRILVGVDQAIDDVDLQRLDDIVRRLQPIEPRLARDLQECRVDTSIRQGSTESPASPIPTLPQPSSTPTR